MPKKRQPKRKAKKIPEKIPPSDDFVSVARRIGADEDKGRFETKLKKIASAKTKEKQE